MTGPAEKVISSYLSRPQMGAGEESNSKPIVISKVEIRDEHGECVRFQSGQKAWIDIEVTARARATKLSISIYITDEVGDSIFDTSTQRLGHGTFNLNAGEVFKCTFEMHLNMAYGIFHPAILIYRYDTQTRYDSWEPAGTIYVNCEEDVRGSVHCFPKLIAQEIHPAAEQSLAQITGDTSYGKD